MHHVDSGPSLIGHERYTLNCLQFGDQGVCILIIAGLYRPWA